MDAASTPLPCMPPPTIPKRTRSLGATGRIPNRLAAKEAPAAAALGSRNSRRDQFFLLIGLSRDLQLEPSKMLSELEGAGDGSEPAADRTRDVPAKSPLLHQRS